MSIQSSTADSHAPPIFRELTDSECRALLARHNVGRIAFSFHARDLNLVMGPVSRGGSARFLSLIHI